MPIINPEGVINADPNHHPIHIYRAKYISSFGVSFAGMDGVDCMAVLVTKQEPAANEEPEDEKA